MSRSILEAKGLVIATHEAALELPIAYVLHSPTENEPDGFKISIYLESWLKGDKTQRDANSDIPFCTWVPERGLASVNHKFTWFRDAGLVPQIEELCQAMYEAWSAD